MSRPFLSISAAVLLAAAAACRDATLGSAPVPADLRVDPAEVVLRAGRADTITATPLDARGQALETMRVRFWSDRPDIATVDSLTGVVMAMAPGTATVTVVALPVRTTVRVTVEPAGGSAVASFGVDTGPVLLDTWALSTQYLGFHAANAAGESLCGIVPLAFRSDTTVFSARYAPPAGNPCLITLLPRDAGGGWLVVEAGGAADSVWVDVVRTRFRWAFGTSPDTGTVGTQRTVEFYAVAEDGQPVAGLAVAFVLTGVPEPVIAWTGADGFARVTATLPLHPLSTRSTWCNRTCSASTSSSGFMARVEARLPDGTTARDSVTVPLRPDAPDHIEILASHTENSTYNSPWTWSGSSSNRYRRLNADTATLQRFESRTVRDEQYYQSVSTARREETLAVIVADHYGNPTGVIPGVTSDDGKAQVVMENDYVEESSAFTKPLGISGTGFSEWARWEGGRVGITNLRAPFAATRVTFSAPGIPSRSITVTGVDTSP